KIENRHKRVRRKFWGPRTLDIDIILYGYRLIRTKDLIVPHPCFLLRDFVLVPLRELNSNLKIPNYT
ncbi:2-amino-4-hydroxy-6-hydroxymethyldihydropteridine diphosphokinase, partial [Legionella pneumophila]